MLCFTDLRLDVGITWQSTASKANDFRTFFIGGRCCEENTIKSATRSKLIHPSEEWVLGSNELSAVSSKHSCMVMATGVWLGGEQGCFYVPTVDDCHCDPQHQGVNLQVWRKKELNTQELYKLCRCSIGLRSGDQINTSNSSTRMAAPELSQQNITQSITLPPLLFSP